MNKFGSQNQSLAARDLTGKRLARGSEYDKFSPIRQTGAQIGSDSAGLGGFNLADDRGFHELDLDSTENLSNLNQSTLSPQRLHSIREEVAVGRGRILESQPGGELLGEPLYPNLDSQKRQRFGRPFTNSPFPYMQKRSAGGKTKF